MSISTDSINIISARISQALAISQLLISDGSETKDGFLNSHENIVNSIWAIADLLCEVKKEISK